MNIYLIGQNKISGYDSYDSAVVIAESETQARMIHPHSQYGFIDPIITDWNEPYSTWAPSYDHVTAKLIGVADPSYNTPVVICASYNAG